MSNLPSWEKLLKGEDCPFCNPQKDVNDYTIKVADLGISTLWLDREQTYRGYCLLIFTGRHVTGLEQLTAEEYKSYADDLKNAAQAVSRFSGAEHMNYASLGNVIPHLHFHIIPRHENDPRWGGPVWTTRREEMIHIALEDDDAYRKRAAEIRACLDPKALRQAY